jgi:5-methylcytosine-specific restriction protein A
VPWPTTSRHERGYGTEWDKTRLRILERDSHLCQPCLKEGRVHVGNQVDHRIPKAKGGTDDDDNLQAINGDCHKAKTALENGAKPVVQIGTDGWPIG